MNPLAASLAKLGLRYCADQLDDLLALAIKRRLGAQELLEYIVEQEQKARTTRSLEHRIKKSHLGRFKTIADFDWAWPEHIDRQAVDSALRLDFLDGARNVILVGNQGLGKTMIAQNIAHQAALAGHGVLFLTAAQLLLDLAAQESARALERRLRHFTSRTSLLVLDEIGYLSYDARNADLLYQVVNRRYERKSLILTTNLEFSKWPTIFPTAGSAIALIDRLIHHSDIIAIQGKSYRLREADAERERRFTKKKSAT